MPLCLILIPSGRKRDESGREIDFDAVYERLIVPAVTAVGLEPLRVDAGEVGRRIHKPQFEQLLLCDFAVVDLTMATANLCYEVGARQAIKPRTTLLLLAGRGEPPCDVACLGAIPYGLAPGGLPDQAAEDQARLQARLVEARRPHPESSLYQLMGDYPLDGHTKTDRFRTSIDFFPVMKKRLARARKAGLVAVRKVEAKIPDLADCEAGVVVDLLLSYRAVEGWEEMIELTGQISPVLADTVLVREQLGLALNRVGRGDEAEEVLFALIREHGPTSETLGILGRVYKERWEEAVRAGKKRQARRLLEMAIAAYLHGFEADWRDPYPGINAITLMEVQAPPDPRGERLMPVVAYAVERKCCMGTPDYWDHATLLELAVLARDEAKADEALTAALSVVREPWEPATTAVNLRLIREARTRRGEEVTWVLRIEAALEKRSAEMRGARSGFGQSFPSGRR